MHTVMSGYATVECKKCTPDKMPTKFPFYYNGAAVALQIYRLISTYCQVLFTTEYLDTLVSVPNNFYSRSEYSVCAGERTQILKNTLGWLKSASPHLNSAVTMYQDQVYYHFDEQNSPYYRGDE